MDVLRAWLAPTLHDKLAAVLGRNRGRNTHASLQNTCEDDESNLRVELSDVQGVVQIVEFQTYEDPIQAIVSDSIVSIQAVISSEAGRKYKAVTRRRVTEGTRGGLIQLRSSELIATHLGPIQSQLKLLIKDFVLIGCEGSGIFGHPQDIMARKEIQSLLGELNEIRYTEQKSRRSPSPGREDSSDDVSIRSQATEHSLDEGQVNTQMGFMTQIPTSTKALKCVSAQGDSKMAPATPRSSEKPAPHVYGMEDVTRVSSIAKKTASSGADLMKLLAEVQKSNAKPNQLPLKDKKTEQNSSCCTNDAATGHDERNMPDEHSRSKPPNSTKVDSIQDTTATVPLDSLLQPSTVHHEPESSSDLPSVIATEDSGHVDRLDGLSALDVSNGHETFKSSQGLVAELRENVETQSRDQEIDSKTKMILSQSMPSEGMDNQVYEDWKDIRRIRRKDVRISKDQQLLLDNANSWLPPQPGYRGPIANVPIAVLDSLNKLADQRASQLTRSGERSETPKGESVAERSSGESCSDTEDDADPSEDDMDSDVSRPVTEWPSSPPIMPRHAELPRDSSPEIIEHVERQPITTRPTQAEAPSSKSQSDEILYTEIERGPGLIERSESEDLPQDDIEEDKAMNIAVPTARDLVQGQVLNNVDEEPRTAMVDSEALGHEQQKYSHMGLLPPVDQNSSISRPGHHEESDTDSSLVEFSVPTALPDPILHVQRTPDANAKVESRLHTDDQPFYQRPLVTTPISANYNNAIDDGILADQQLQSELEAHSQSRSQSPIKTQSEKRIAESEILSPNITKRRKRHQPNFSFSQDPQFNQDPSAPLRRNRQERKDFLASRKALLSTSDVDVDLEELTEAVPEDVDIRNGQVSTGDDQDEGMQLDHQEDEIDLDTRSLTQQVIDLDSSEHVFAPLKDTVHQFSPRSPLKRTADNITCTSPVTISNVTQYPVDHASWVRGDLACVFPTSTGAISSAHSLFERFKATYQAYDGDIKHLTAMAKRIDYLIREDRIEHPCLWDDFIMRHRSEFRKYMFQCTEEAEDPMSYEDFYRTVIHEPTASRNIITPSNLHILLDRAAPAKPPQTPSRVVRPELVDLTNDTSVERRKSQSTALRRSLPWKAKDSDRKVVPVSPAEDSRLRPPPPSSPPQRPIASQLRPNIKTVAETHSVVDTSHSTARPPLSAQKLDASTLNHQQSSASYYDQSASNQHHDIPPSRPSPPSSPVASSLTNLPHHSSMSMSTSNEWWKDANTPFNSFARAYTSISSGKGNAFASSSSSSSEPGVEDRLRYGHPAVDGQGLIKVEMKRLGVLEWKV